ncbi:MAG: hypothetical protein MCSN_1530 [Candidatus Microsyncoccus archaeolyticus]|jgi:triacylglycerol esterase/lipase EstA (alpha/beta hydrolase family)|nr:MAG: hypothetical protein MCSN_1530 [Candidatus Parcubacteria bacterium]
MDLAEREEHLNNIELYSYSSDIGMNSFKKLAQNASEFKDWYQMSKKLLPNNPLFPLCVSGMLKTAKSPDDWNTLSCFAPTNRAIIHYIALKEIKNEIDT